MVILGNKQAIRKGEINKFYYTLNKAFNLIGEKREGESWEHLKYSHISCNLIDILSDLIRYDFFDLFGQDDARNKLNDRQKLNLLSDAVNSQSFARKIANRDKNVFIDDYEQNEINYNFPTNFLIPKEQFDYVLKTGRRWQDRKPQKNGIIFSKFHTDFSFVSSAEMIMVGSWENVMNYSTLVSFLKNKFQATDWEIKIWLYDKKLTILRGNCEDDGYMPIEHFSNKPEHYKPTFYYKKEVEEFNPTFRFLEYHQVKEKWQKDFGEDENATLELILKYFDEYDLASLFGKEDWHSKTCPPRHKEYNKTGKSNLNQTDRIDFIKNCLFEEKYIKKIETKHLCPITIDYIKAIKEQFPDKSSFASSLGKLGQMSSIAPSIFKAQNELKLMDKSLTAPYENFKKHLGLTLTTKNILTPSLEFANILPKLPNFGSELSKLLETEANKNSTKISQIPLLSLYDNVGEKSDTAEAELGEEELKQHKNLKKDYKKILQIVLNTKSVKKIVGEHKIDYLKANQPYEYYKSNNTLPAGLRGQLFPHSIFKQNPLLKSLISETQFVKFVNELGLQKNKSKKNLTKNHTKNLTK